MNDEMTFTDILAIFKNKLKYIIVATVSALVIACLITYFFITPKYTSVATMITSFTTLEKGIDDIPNQVTTAQLGASTALAKTYTVILKSDYCSSLIYDEIKNNYEMDGLSPKLIKNSISISQVNETEVLNIKVTTVDPQLSKDICNALLKVSPSIVEEKSYGKLNVLDTGTLPLTASSPSMAKNAIIGALIGFLLSVAVIFIFYLSNKKVQDGREIEKKFDVPVLGSIPEFGDPKKKTKSPYSYGESGKSRTNFFVVEAYKTIRTNLMYTFNRNSNNIIAVSGAEANAGKSVTCSNLALTFAQNNFKVLIIDADMRKPTQQKHFKCQNVDGLSKVLSGQSTVARAVQKNIVSNIDLLTSGPIPPNPSELMSSEEMKKLLEAVSKEYDCVIIDTPPINYVTDCLTIANIVCGVLLVARQGATEYSELANAIDSLRSIDGKILGIIVNDVKNSYAGGRYYHNKYYYTRKYESDESENKENKDSKEGKE